MRRLFPLLPAIALLLPAAARAETIYVSNEKDSSVTVVDGATSKATATWPTGRRARGIQISHDGHLWASAITQKHNGIGASPSYAGSGFDVGGKLTFGPASLLGYYHDGSGIGTTGPFILSTDAAERKRDGIGFYVPGTVAFGNVTAAARYGETNLGFARGAVNPTLLDKTSSYVGQLSYGLTSWVTLVGEYRTPKSEAPGPNDARSDALAAGAILFF